MKKYFYLLIIGVLLFVAVCGCAGKKSLKGSQKKKDPQSQIETNSDWEPWQKAES